METTATDRRSWRLLIENAMTEKGGVERKEKETTGIKEENINIEI